MRDPAEHAARKKMVAKAFSPQGLQAFEPFMNEKIVSPLLTFMSL